MEILANTEYQDLYRISDGVLLVVNKFSNICINQLVRVYDKGGQTYYGHGTQKCLCVLKTDQVDWNGVKVPKDTVTWNGVPVRVTDNKSDWTCEIKTTGSSLGGDFETVENMLSTILRIMRIGK